MFTATDCPFRSHVGTSDGAMELARMLICVPRGRPGGTWSDRNEYDDGLRIRPGLGVYCNTIESFTHCSPGKLITLTSSLTF